MVSNAITLVCGLVLATVGVVALPFVAGAGGGALAAYAVLRLYERRR